ncbi:MAG: hypothetical protein ACI8PZ_003141 [Myxococcota bacterium]|jgi:hypothetical protein
MLMWMLAACAPVETAPADWSVPELHAPPPAALTLHAPTLERGRSVTLTTSGATPGASVTFLRGAALGPGPCPALLDGGCMGITPPLGVLGLATADLSGVARLTFTVPEALARPSVALQAVERTAPGLSDPVSAALVDPPIPPPYPERTAWDLKSIQPDFWPSPDEISGNAAGGVAMNLVWAAWEPTVSAPPCAPGQEAYAGHCFTVDAGVDAAIADWTDRGLTVTAVVYGVPAWARVEPCSPAAPGFDIFCAPIDPADYARFTGFLARRYDGARDRGHLSDFVVHNEVNSNTWFDVGCGEHLGPCDADLWRDTYADGYVAAFDAIRSEQPEAKVFVSLEHHFDARWDLPAADAPVLSGQSIITAVADRAGDRDWRIAFHPYPPDLFRPEFSPDDLRDAGKVTYGSLGGLLGWLHATFPDRPHAHDVHLTESGVNSTAPSDESAQDAALCDSFRSILGTPGVANHIYHRMQDNPAEGGLGLGLRRADGSAKPAWATWALMNRPDVADPACGFEHLPYTRLTRSYDPARGHWASTRPAPSSFAAESSTLLLRDEAPGTVLLYECAVGDHSMLTRDSGCEGQLPLGPVGWAWADAEPGTSPLHRCRIGLGDDHFVSLDPGCEGQVLESVLGWVLPG